MITIPIKILDAAEGLRLKALITAYPKTEITIDGPKTAINIIDTINKVSAHCTAELLYNPLVGPLLIRANSHMVNRVIRLRQDRLFLFAFLRTKTLNFFYQNDTVIGKKL